MEEESNWVWLMDMALSTALLVALWYTMGLMR